MFIVNNLFDGPSPPLKGRGFHILCGVAYGQNPDWVKVVWDPEKLPHLINAKDTRKGSG
jgi:hypothetical protein